MNTKHVSKAIAEHLLDHMRTKYVTNVKERAIRKHLLTIFVSYLQKGDLNTVPLSGLILWLSASITCCLDQGYLENEHSLTTKQFSNQSDAENNNLGYGLKASITSKSWRMTRNSPRWHRMENLAALSSKDNGLCILCYYMKFEISSSLYYKLRCSYQQCQL